MFCFQPKLLISTVGGFRCLSLASSISGMKLTEMKPTAAMHTCMRTFCCSSQVQDSLVRSNPIRSTKGKRVGTHTDNECVTRSELSFSWGFLPPESGSVDVKVHWIGEWPMGPSHVPLLPLSVRRSGFHSLSLLLQVHSAYL